MLANPNNDSLISVDWSWQCTDCTPLVTYSFNTEAETQVNTDELEVGHFKILVEVTYADGGEGPRYKLNSSMNIEVLAPDSLILNNACLNTPISLSPAADSPGVYAYFVIMGGGRRLNVNSDAGSVQEKLDRSNYGASNYFNYASLDWTTGPFLTITANSEIKDGKGYVVDFLIWGNMINNTDFDEFDQSLRLVLTDGCGTTFNKFLGTIHLKATKSGGNWILSQVP